MDVLVVDDSRSMRMLIKRCMRQAGYGTCALEEASDGVEGLAKMKEAEPRLVLSDWNMTGMGGEQFAHQVREAHPNVVVGFITSEASAEINERAMATGARFLLTKPFDAEGMAAVLKPYLKVA